ncbi:conserved hypothetical protein [Vibrio chagasii]|nr:conserved hypothetical protein [Vibrio chagasii]CAH7251030.1 conserved hypothetical protein [Vibrio chagasii]
MKTNQHQRSQYKRSARPLAALNRERWRKLLENPSQYDYLLSRSGKSTQRQYLTDIGRVMDYLVSELEFRTCKVGVVTANGFLLRTWANVAKGTGLPEWRVKQCVSYAKDRGWITSKQPRENINGDWYGLASIKRITDKYFRDLGLNLAYENAKQAATKNLKKLAVSTGVHIRYLLTPITLLRKFARRNAQPHYSTVP